MKKLLLLPAIAFAVLFASCGPAAEKKDEMLARAKVFQDSLANMIKTQMAEAEAPGPNPVVVPTPAPAATAAATATAPAK